MNEPDRRDLGRLDVVPGVRAARTYERRWVRRDLVAGMVLAAILVPQGMAYAELAGLPAVTGLYTTIACLLGYAVMGPSRILVLGPDSALGPLIFAAIAPLVIAGDDPGKAIALAGMMAVLVGLIEIGLGLGRLGFVADLLSKEVQVGYMNGLAIAIVVGQLPKLSGFSTDADGFVDELRAFASGFVDGRDDTALVLGLVVLAVLVILPRVTSTVPAMLVAIVGITIVTAVLDLDVTTVGALPEGLPRPALPWTDIGDVVPMLVAALGVTMVSLTDTITTSTAFGARRGDVVDPNGEMVGIGTANVAAGLFSGFAVSSSSSRTAVAEQSGARSQLTGVIGAAMVALMLVFLPSLLTDLPEAALAAIVIAAAFSMVSISAVVRFARVRPTAFLLSLTAMAGVVFLGVLPGILVAVALSVLLFFRRNWWPHGELLGQIPGREGWHSVALEPGAGQLPDVVVFRWEAPLFFANVHLFGQTLRRHVRARDAHWVVLQCEAITDIDVTAADALERLNVELNEQGVHMAFVELRTRLAKLLAVYGSYAELDPHHFYGSIDEALADIANDPHAG